jgi:hypothetical protein
MKVVKVHAAYDAEAGVWFVEDSTLPGLSAEADTFEALAAKLPNMIADLMEDAGDDWHCVPIELIAHRTLQASISA